MARSIIPKDLGAFIVAWSGEVFDVFCQPCSLGIHVEAVVYCQECSEFLCTTCTEGHGKLSATKHHNVLRKSTMTQIKPSPKTQYNDELTKKCRDEAVPVRQDVTATKARYIRELSVKTVCDTMRCGITGIAVVAKELLVITDYYNRAIKLYDMKKNKLTCISHLVLSSKPIDITKIKANHVAVAVVDVDKIVIISVVDNTLFMRHIINPPRDGITGLCFNGSNFIVAFVYPASVKTINMAGKTLNTISTDDKGDELFHCPVAIAVSRDKDAVYVTDWAAGTVTSLTPSGRVNWVYRHDELKWPLGVAVDKDGAVFVCSRGTDTVHQLNSNGVHEQIILRRAQGLELISNLLRRRRGLPRNPCAIAYDEKKDILYISSNSYIRLFQLK